jgi:hypothetical protein
VDFTPNFYDTRSDILLINAQYRRSGRYLWPRWLITRSAVMVAVASSWRAAVLMVGAHRRGAGRQ